MKTDGWGQPMDFYNGQIRSGGPDLTKGAPNDADDITYPSVAFGPANGNINLVASIIDGTTGTPVTFGTQAVAYYASNGAMLQTPLQLANGTYSFNNLPQGVHAISITQGPLPGTTRTLTVYCPAGGTVQQTVTFR